MEWIESGAHEEMYQVEVREIQANSALPLLGTELGGALM